jgi:DNA-binding response OmpR family regulator
MRVLLAEDHDSLRHLFAQVLKRNGFEVREAANGREALESLGDFEPDVVVTDLMMPEIDGIELMHRLRAMPLRAETPVVIMTAAATDEARSEAIRFGAVDFLAKPFDSRTLLERVSHLCG